MALRIHYVINARVPHVRAYGIQIAKMSEALIEAGAELTLVIPHTLASREDMQEVNMLRIPVRTVVLPGLDWYDKGKIPFLIASLVFMVSSFIHLMREKRRSAIDLIYTVDMDTFSYAILPFTGIPVVAEMHGAKRATPANRYFFRRVRRLIATNQEIADALATTFSIPSNTIIVEPNGVDVSEFEHVPDTSAARNQLGLPVGARIALYAGRFYAWKGLDILVRAAALAPDVQWYVIGGTEESFKSFTGASSLPENLHVMGDKPSSEIPVWLSVADALLILGTKAHEQSYRFTAPMKIYEYMAARRPVVAAGTPALRGIIQENEANFYTPDDASDLVRAVARTIENDTKHQVERAFAAAAEHTWLKRAQRVLSSVSL